MSDILQELDKVLEQRRKEDSANSYVASLCKTGLDNVLKKIGEECSEMVAIAKIAEIAQAIKDEGDEESQQKLTRLLMKIGGAVGDAKAREALVQETADLWFHCMVMLSYLGCDSSQVLEVLQQRFGTSGLAEKASRDKK